MLLLYFPQVTMPLFLVLVITGAGHFWGWSGALGPEQGGRGIRWVDRAVLPVLEGAVLLAILRYPDGGGRSGAATGLGADGAAALALAVVFWVVWLAGRGQRPIVRRRELVHWAVRFAAVWAAASLLAAPQLLPTAELIAHSSLSGQVFSEGGFFTGVQAYGSVQNFLDLSALAKPKESVNNMALGPAVYLLVFAGVLGGFHRRRRLFLIFWLGALAVGAVYFDLPIAGPLVQRLPFFNKFPGLSRYLAFLNFFLVMLALLSARLWLARLKGKARRAALTAIILGLAANLLLLARHETRYFTYLKEKTRPYSIPAAVDEMLRANIAADERVILDPTTHEAYFQAMMYGARAQLPVLPGYGPLRLASYDRWLAAHNRSLGRDTDFFLGDYRAKVFEPRPSPWSRALRVRGFLFPPGENARRDAALAKGELAALAQAENWVLLADPQMLPAAWPERDLHRDPPVPEVPAGWQVRRVKENPNRAFYRVVNPGDAVWLVVPDPNYPGWCAWVDDKPAELATAYGFLQAVRVPGGTSCVRLEFRPQSFILGWLCFLWAVWGWAALFVMALARAFGLGRSPGPLSCALLAAGGLALVAGIGSLGLWSTPDSFIQRVVEAVATAQIAVLAGYFAVRYAPRRTGKRQGHPDGAFPKAGRAAIP